ncbi:hypothetical protein FPOAC2_07491 [Fusarium poae]|uniref:LysM domain-containing protein n=1 Tax=Fusarium poae TaxID=36050 RepID=A0A1B8AIC0_FUSPO|nr:hypothetical protein FPOAC1_010091 [Fusarium poae]KAG8670658.1 hypothetical protein FPOAC1_010091 [Fusarium poae]OBS20309.1 hypothetical protein FPOA_06683 [Fusarium poae]
MIRLIQLVTFAGLLQESLSGVIDRHTRRDSFPKFPHDERTTTDCTWWFDMNEPISCNQLLEDNVITIDQFRRWNPTITAECGGMAVGNSYCVEAWFESIPQPQPGTSAKPTATKPTQGTPVKPTNGVKTPEPLQPDVVSNCKTFHFVQKGETCSSIAVKNKISLSKFLEWNSEAQSDCSGLWSDAWACVMTLDYKENNNTPTPSPTTPSNGINTPQPTQLILADNCNKFYFVKSGESCAYLASKYSITKSEFLKWNPSVESDCGGLWAEAWACVSVIGHQKPSTTAKPTATAKPSATNNVPTPVQAGIAEGCNKYHLVQKTTTCDSIEKHYTLPFATFFKWNPSVGNNCQSLLAGYYVCVSVTGWTPTPTTGNNGVETPLPIQNGMTSSCNKFHLISKTTTCSSIESYYKIDMTDFMKWNTAINRSCTNLLAGYNVCIGVIGQKPKPSPTTPAGVQTPSPVQTNMVKGCKKFHLIKPTTTCASIQNYYKISWANLYKWNPAIGSACTLLWEKYWVCVAA